MSDIILRASLAVLAWYYISFIFNKIARRVNWSWWYRKVYLNSLHWKIVRWMKKTNMRILRGAVYCEKCGNRKRLQVHHMTYANLWHEKMSDLQIVCNLCHRQGSGRIS